MRTPADQMNAILDRIRKQAAQRPVFPTGGDGRSTAEVVNTGAAARNLAMTATKKPKIARLG